jgi:hypothetical protein
MKTGKFRVYFEDEAPTIGSGWRPVIAKIGYKWVHVRDPNAQRGKKIKRDVWDKLRKEARYEGQAVQESHP